MKSLLVKYFAVTLFACILWTCRAATPAASTSPADITPVDTVEKYDKRFPFKLWIDENNRLAYDTARVHIHPSHEELMKCIVGRGWTLDKCFLYDPHRRKTPLTMADGIITNIQVAPGLIGFVVAGGSILEDWEMFPRFYFAEDGNVNYYTKCTWTHPYTHKATDYYLTEHTKYSYDENTGILNTDIFSRFSIIKINNDEMWLIDKDCDSSNQWLHVLRIVSVAPETLQGWNEKYVDRLPLPDWSVDED